MLRRWAAPGIAIALVVVGLFAVLSQRGGSLGLEGSPSTVQRGREVYAVHCAACHGADRQGAPEWKTRAADGSFPPPPHDATGHTWHHGDGVLFRIVKEGGEIFATPSAPSRMPAFGDSLCDSDIHAVLEYLKSRWGSRERDFQEQVSRESPYPPLAACE